MNMAWNRQRARRRARWRESALGAEGRERFDVHGDFGAAARRIPSKPPATARPASGRLDADPAIDRLLASFEKVSKQLCDFDKMSRV